MHSAKIVSALVVISVFGICIGVDVKSCSRNAANNILKVNWFNAAPKPLVVPGDLSFGTSFTFERPLSGNLNVDITISRLFGIVWMDIPCVRTPFGRLGSCSYSNVCGILASMNGTVCPSLLKANGIKCTCPVNAGTYNIPNTIIPLNLKKLGIPLPSVAGDYRTSIRVTDANTLQEIICYDVNFTLSDPPPQTTFGNLGRFLVNLFG